MTKVKRNALIAVTVVGVIALGCFIAHKRWEAVLSREIRDSPQPERANKIASHFEFVRQRIRIGMSKEDVRKIVGEPLNDENESVWAWAWNTEELPRTKTVCWLDLMRHCLDFWHIVFVDGKVAQTIYPCAATSPQEFIMAARQCDEKTALILMGVPEKKVAQYLKEQDAYVKSGKTVWRVMPEE